MKMFKLGHVIRAHDAISRMMEAYSPVFLKQSILYSSKDHKLATAFEDLSAQSLKYYVSQSIKHDDYSPKPYFQSIKVDGRKVSTSFMKTIQMKGSEEKVLSHFVDENTIRKSAKPASFGNRDQTVYDEDVRKALEIEASRIQIEYGPGFDKEIVSKLDKLAPQGKRLVPKLYKMHIYDKGGQFLSHRDTIHADNHHATLIVALPTKYTGGDFILHVDGKEESIDLCGSHEGVNKFVFFLTDIPHEVRQVKSGTRIVLQYDLYLEDQSPSEAKTFITSDEDDMDDDDDDYEEDDYNEEDDDDDDNDYYSYNGWKKDDMSLSQKSALHKPKPTPRKSLKQENDPKFILPLLEEFIKEKPNESVCFLLTHKYPLAIQPDMLKAADRVLYNMISSKYEVDLGLAFNVFVTDYDGKFPSGDASKRLNVMDFDSVQCFRMHVNGIYPFAVYEENFPDKNEKAHVFVGDTSFFERVKAKKYVDRTGNEVSLGHYVYASVVLAVGPRKQ